MPRIKGKNGFPLSEETKKKIGLANKGIWIKYNCDFCGKGNEEKQSHYKRKTNHFCSQNCHSSFQKTIPMVKQAAYKGVRKEGESRQIYHRRYCKNNPENISHLKARRYARERGAEGSHILQEWIDLKEIFNNKCGYCREEKKLTKDHIIPLSEGGTDYIYNIQPLCRNCNSKKWKHIYSNLEPIKP